MKPLVLLKFIFLIVLSANAQNPGNPDTFNLIKDEMNSCVPSDIEIHGYLGERMQQVINRRIKVQDVEHLVEPFKHRAETRFWQTEFWGKWILSAIAAYKYNSDPELLAIINKAAKGLLETQTSDGYIGNYSPEAQLEQWDIWGRKYTLLGLLAYYDLTNDKKALKGAVNLADHLMTQVGTGKADIVKTGNYRGMPSSSILEPVVFLYRRTGDTKYLEFAKYIVAQWETADGPKLVSNALEGIPVSERFPHPQSWWSWENGQKAYEMMSCYEGLLELYRITGEPVYLKAVEMAVHDINNNEINLAGSGSSFECFYKGAQNQTRPAYHTMETCVTMTWMKLCFNLLRVTGNPAYADMFEKSAFNALLAALKYDGSQIAKYSPIDGVRHEGEEQCGMHINCCNANGPRAFMLLPEFAVTKKEDAVFINLYGSSKTVIPLNSKNTVSILQVSDYPLSGKIELDIDPVKPEAFTIALRIPAWCAGVKVRVNNEPLPEIVTGSYLKIERTWHKNDRIWIEMDLKGKIVTLNGYQAIVRGPVLLARDTRFNDGFINEAAVISITDDFVSLPKSESNPENIWMSFTALLLTGTDLEGEFSKPWLIRFCDFASAGNTWGEDSRYKVWIPVTFDVREAH